MASAIPPSAPRGAPRERPRQTLAPCIQRAFGDLGSRYAREGVRVFLFGSVARFWPEAPLGADFDVGYEASDVTAVRLDLRRRLEEDLAALPSIRPVDLVDFSAAPEPFRSIASRWTIDLAHVSAPSAEN